MKDNKYKIVEVGIKDFEKKNYLFKLSDTDLIGRWGVVELSKFILKSGARVLVVIENQEPLGLSLFRYAADEMEIIDFEIQQKHRNQGAGSFLLDSLLNEAKNFGIREIYLEVSAKNIFAIKLYTNKGFVKVGERDNYYTSHQSKSRINALLLKKSLSSVN